MKIRLCIVPVVLIIISILLQISDVCTRKSVNCGFVCYRWRKCKSKLSGLTGSRGHRPAEAGTTGQLFFKKCGTPRDGCVCEEAEEVKKEEVKEDLRPHFPKNLVEFINNEAHDWLSNLVQID